MSKSLLYIVIPKLITDTDDRDCMHCLNSIQMQKACGWEIVPMLEEGNSYAQIYNQVLNKLEQGYIWFLYPWIILKEGTVNAFTEILGRSGDEDTELFVFGYEKLSWNIPYEHRVLNRKVSAGNLANEYLDYSEDEKYVALWNKIYQVDVIKKHQIRFDETMQEGYGACFLFHYLAFCKQIQFADLIECQYIEDETKELGVYERISEKEKLYRVYEQYETVIHPDVDLQSVHKYWINYLVYEYARVWDHPKEERKKICQLLKNKRAVICDTSRRTDFYILQAVVRNWLSPKRIKNMQFQKRQRRLELRRKKKACRFQKRIHFVRKMSKKLAAVFRKKKHVLLYCESKTMFPHIWEYYECVKHNEDVDFYIYYPKQWNDVVQDEVTLVKSEVVAWYKYWDLIVCADASVPLQTNKEEMKLLYINHGLHMISYDSGESLYAYSKGHGISEKGEPLFSAMFEPNVRYADLLVRQNPLLQEHVFHVGYKYVEQIQRAINQHEDFRAQFLFKKKDIVVAVFGSWGRDSLFHKVGDELLKQAKGLLSEGYQFILSIHPREYENYDPNITALGSQIEQMREEGFVVRNPKDSSVPYLNAADIVICDFSTLCEEAMIAGKKIILSEFPDKRVWKYSTIADYKKKGLVFGKDTDLKQMIQMCLSDERYAELCREYAKELFPPAGGYKYVVNHITKQLLEGEIKWEHIR